MLKFLSLTAALSTAFVTLLSGPSLGFPLVLNTNDPSQVIFNPTNGSTTGFYDPFNNSRQVIFNPSNGSQTVIGSPYNNPYTRTTYPSNGSQIVIINIINVNRIPLQSTCSTAIIGSPIPSPIPLNTRTGLPCR
jgi:hypothetical protein